LRGSTGEQSQQQRQHRWEVLGLIVSVGGGGQGGGCVYESDGSANLVYNMPFVPKSA
jgi:hypothetical protein